MSDVWVTNDGLLAFRHKNEIRYIRPDVIEVEGTPWSDVPQGWQCQDGTRLITKLAGNVGIVAGGDKRMCLPTAIVKPLKLDQTVFLDAKPPSARATVGSSPEKTATGNPVPSACGRQRVDR